MYPERGAPKWYRAGKNVRGIILHGFCRDPHCANGHTPRFAVRVLAEGTPPKPIPKLTSHLGPRLFSPLRSFFCTRTPSTTGWVFHTVTHPASSLFPDFWGPTST